MSKRAPYQRYRREDVKAVGVTFDNRPEDGGGSRQEILMQLQGEPSMGRLEHVSYHNPETGDDEPAIRIRSKRTWRVIGYVPKDRVQEFWNDTEMVLQVTEYKGTYGCILTRPERPSPKQYGAMMSLRRRGSIGRMPMYDKTAYQWALAQRLPQR